MEILQTFHYKDWQEKTSTENQQTAIHALESGKILYFPQLSFTLSEQEKSFLSPDYVDPQSKNISFTASTAQLGGVRAEPQQCATLTQIMQRYASVTQNLIQTFLPSYIQHLKMGRTSFRPVEIVGRVSSYRKDDTRLHVDAFPSSPNQGKRILRIFTNVNPENKPRVWRVGEPFTQIAQKFLPSLPKPWPGIAFLLKLFKITRSYRTLYDHYMLHLHDTMKADATYQKNAPQQEILFPPGSTWMVYTDCVSHAAMSGQHLFEQTFYLPVSGMANPAGSPLHILQKLVRKNLT